MMYEDVAQKLGMTHRRVGDTSAYLESPLTIPEDGSHIGAYVSALEGNRVRITDDADILFRAITHGVQPSVSRGNTLRAIAAQCGVSLSDDGEVFATCDVDELPYYLARFLEASDRIAYAANGFRPKPSSAFELVLARVLAKAFPARVKRNFKVYGASGHQLTFPFVMDPTAQTPKFIQAVAANDGKANWSSVYQALGKMTDLKNNVAQPSRRIVVMEAIPAKDIQQASTALADAAAVIIYRSADELVQRLAA